jgi:hypothetical protein
VTVPSGNATVAGYRERTRDVARRIAVVMRAEAEAEHAAALAWADRALRGEICRAEPVVALAVVPVPVVSEIPQQYRDVFEAVCLQDWDGERERCGAALTWLEAHDYIYRTRGKYPRSKHDPLGRPARLTVKGQTEAKRLGYEISKIIASTPCSRKRKDRGASCPAVS